MGKLEMEQERERVCEGSCLSPLSTVSICSRADRAVGIKHMCPHVT